LVRSKKPTKGVKQGAEVASDMDSKKRASHSQKAQGARTLPSYVKENAQRPAMETAEETRAERVIRLEEDKLRDRELVSNLGREKETLQVIMERTHAQLAYLDSSFNFIMVNSAYEKGSGKKAEELVGHNHFDLFPNEENQKIFEKVRDTREPVEFKAKAFVFKDQPERGITYWDWTLSPVSTPEGVVTGLVLSLSDVTEAIRTKSEMERLLSALEASNRDLGTLERMADRFVSSIDFGQLLKTMLETLAEYTQADGAGVVLFENGYARLRSAIGEGVGLYPMGTRVSEGSFAGEMMTGKKALHISDIKKDDRIKSPSLLTSRVASLLGIPLVNEDETIGILFLGWVKEREFDEREDKVLRIAASRFSMAIRNAQLYEAARESERLSLALNEIDMAIKSDRSFDDLMKDVSERIARNLQVDRVAMYSLDGEELVQVYGYGLPQAVIGQRFTRETANVTFHCMETGRAECIDDVENDPRVDFKAYRDLGLKSMITAPLKLRGVPIGALVAVNIHSGPPFSAPSVDFLAKVASSVALAIDNSRLLDEEKRERYVLQTILDNSPAAIAIVGGRENRIRWSNAAFRSFLDPSLVDEEISAMRLEEQMPVFKASGMETALKAARLTGKPVANKELEKEAGGVATFWRYSAIPLTLTGAVGQDLMVVAVDITEQIMARRRIERMAIQAESERIRLRTILDNLPVGVIIVDDKGGFVEVNKRTDQIWAAHQTATTIDEYRKFKAWWADTGLPVQAEEWAMAQAVNHGRTTMGQAFDIVRADGTRGTILASGAPLKDVRGATYGGVTVIQDITMQRQLEHDALESKALSEFYVDLLCNDIGQLNTAIMEGLKAVSEAKGEADKLERRVNESLETAEEGLKLIDVVKKIQMVESHRLKLGLVDLGLTIGEVVSEMSEKHPDELHVVYESALWHTTNATDLLGDAFRYLIEDTIDAAPGTKHLEISITEAYESNKQFHKVVFEDDTGDKSGRIRAKAFSLPRRGAGGNAIADLRLYLVRIIVEACHGRVWVESRHKGDWSKGRRFVMMLPSAVIKQDYLETEEEKPSGEQD
jgi:PAS domain S-box-containing protein